MKYLLLSLIKIYQFFLSPKVGIFRQFYFFPAACRFEESCSDFAYRIIKERGSLKGSVLAIKRLGRCHPFLK